MGWNCNGWGRDKAADKSTVISNSHASAFMLNETWLRYEDKLDIPGYTFIGNNRKKLHKNACVGSGGVAILINDDMLNQFTIDWVDSNYESMLAVKLKDKISEYVIVLICAYIPPESSRYGWEADVLYEHLTQLIYQYEECDSMLIFGDFNSRVGEKQE